MARNSPYRLLSISGTDAVMFPQKGDLKDSADLSRNLVGPDVEREYGKAAMEKPKRRGLDVCRCLAAVAVTALTLCLLGLTLLRELQLTRVSHEVGSLRADVESLRTQVEALNKHVEAEKNLVNDLNAYEDGVFADLDNSDADVVEDSFPERVGLPAGAGAGGAAPRQGRPGDLDSITVLDDEDDDDQYGEDGEDAGSAWYSDYDHHRQKVGTSGVLKLKPEDFLGKVLNAKPLDAPDRTSKVNELRKMLLQTTDASPTTIGAEAEAVDGGERRKRSVGVESPPEETVDTFAAPRFYTSKIDERRKSKKYDPEAPLSSVPEAPRPLAAPLVARHELPRHTRNSEDETVDAGTPRRSFVAAHFHGNTSHLSTGIHPHYKGNGLVRVSHDAPHDVWSPSDWTRSAPDSSPALTRRGHVSVRRTGIYFVYVQIYYLDAHDITGWVLHRTAADGDGDREPLLQCASTSPSAEPQDKPNSCYSAAALLLRAGDRLAVRNTGGDRHSLMQQEKSFIGLIKLADAEEPAY